MKKDLYIKCRVCGENAPYDHIESSQGGEICQEKYFCADCDLDTSVEVECPDDIPDDI